MKVATVGSFVVSAQAIEQGDMWAGVFRISKYQNDFTTSTDFLGDTHTDDTYPTRAAAEEAALAEGGQWAMREEG